MSSLHTLYHTSPSEIKKIDRFGNFGECLCFSDDVYQMSASKCITYTLELEEDEIIDVNSFFYREDCYKLSGIVNEIMELVNCDEEAAQELLSEETNVFDIISDTMPEADDLKICEISWRIQGYAGEAAKILGYKAAQGYDEQGAVYLVPMSDMINELKIFG